MKAWRMLRTMGRAAISSLSNRTIKHPHRCVAYRYSLHMLHLYGGGTSSQNNRSPPTATVALHTCCFPPTLLSLSQMCSANTVTMACMVALSHLTLQLPSVFVSQKHYHTTTTHRDTEGERVSRVAGTVTGGVGVRCGRGWRADRGCRMQARSVLLHDNARDDVLEGFVGGLQ